METKEMIEILRYKANNIKAKIEPEFFNEVADRLEEYNTDERIKKALKMAWEWGQIDGDHHKMWVIDQMVRALCGSEEEYTKWVNKYTEPLEDGDYYNWDSGIAP